MPLNSVDQEIRMMKIVVVGSSGKEKNEFMAKLCGTQSSAYKSAIGVDFCTYALPDVHVQLWDLSLNSRFNNMANIYLKEAEAIIVVPNQSDKEQLEKWVQEKVPGLPAYTYQEDETPAEAVSYLVGSLKKLERALNQNITIAAQTIKMQKELQKAKETKETEVKVNANDSKSGLGMWATQFSNSLKVKIAQLTTKASAPVQQPQTFGPHEML